MKGIYMNTIRNYFMTCVETLLSLGHVNGSDEWRLQRSVFCPSSLQLYFYNLTCYEIPKNSKWHSKFRIQSILF